MNYYRITNAEKLPDYKQLVRFDGSYYGRCESEVQPGIICNGLAPLAELQPVEASKYKKIFDCDTEGVVTPEQAIVGRGWSIQNPFEDGGGECDLDSVIGTADEDIDYILHGLEPGEVGSLISTGGTGKSMLALTMSMQMASGRPSYLTTRTTKRRVCYLSLEDKLKGVSNRIRRISRKLKINSEQLGGRLRVITKRLTIAQSKKEYNLNAILDLFVGREIPELLIVDTARRLHHLNENDSSEMNLLMEMLETIGECMNCTVLLLHHTTKAAIGATSRGEDVGSEAARGSGALVDNGRGTWYLAKMSKPEANKLGIKEEDRGKYVTLDHSKCNAQEIPPRKVLFRGEYGILEQVDIKPVGHQDTLLGGKGKKKASTDDNSSGGAF